MTSKTALVTGAAKRIGKEITLFLAKRQYNILLHYNHSEQEALQTKALIESLGASCTLKQTDFSNENEVDNLIEDYNIDLLINNASFFENDNIHNMSYTTFQKHFTINLAAPIKLCSAFFKQCRSLQKTGNIINILDYCAAKMPSNFFSYALSKRALWDYTQLAAYEMAPTLRANAIALSYLLKNDTESQAHFEKSSTFSPLYTKPSMEELYTTVEFILNTPSVTGQMILLDGGKHLNPPTPL